MECPSCGREMPSTAHFCPYCGGPVSQDVVATPELAPDSGTSPGDSSQEDATVEEQLRSLRAAVASLASALSAQASRLAALEQRATTAAPQVTSPRAQPYVGTAAPALATSTTAAPAPGPSPRPAVAPVSPTAPVTDPQAEPEDAAGPPPRPGAFDTILADWNWEWLVGGNWLARIGIVALIIGAGFFLKLAIDNNWIGETGQVALGTAGGLLLLAGGEYWRRRYPIWAQPLTGGGIAILYLSIFAAFSFYSLIPSLPALGFFFLVTVTAAGLALRYEAVAIAVLGIIGGFATPLLLWEQLPDQRALLAYVLVLDLGVLALATFRNWRWFTLLGLLGSLALFALWLEELEPGLLLAQVGITGIFLIFVAATTLFHIAWKRVAGPADFSLMMLNAAAYFGISYMLMFEELRPWMGGFTLLLAGFYGLVAYGILLRSGQLVHLTLFALGIALVFVTVAVPVQLGGPWVSVVWAAEGTVLIWLSFILRMHQLRWFGMATFVAFAGWLLFLDTPAALTADHYPFWNVYALVYGIAIALTYGSAYLVYRNDDSLQPWERYLFPVFLTAGSLILTLAVPTQVGGVWLPITWAVEALALVALSFYLGLSQLRLFSLGVFGIMVVRLLVFDTFDIDWDAFWPIVNWRFLAFTVAIIAAYLSAILWWLKRDQYIDERERFLVVAYLVVANALTLWALSAEVIATGDSSFFDVPSGNVGNVISLALSILWAVYAAALMIVGIARSSRWIRLAGLGLLAVPIVKLFAYDVFSLEREFRVAAFLGLGVILVVGGFLYQKYSRAIRGFILE